MRTNLDNDELDLVKKVVQHNAQCANHQARRIVPELRLTRHVGKHF